MSEKLSFAMSASNDLEFLLDKLFPVVELVVDHLVERGVLFPNKDDYQDIRAEPTALRKSRKLLRVLSRLGARAIQIFSQILQEQVPELSAQQIADIVQTSIADKGLDQQPDGFPSEDRRWRQDELQDAGRARKKDGENFVSNMQTAYLERARKARYLDFHRLAGQEPEGLEKVYFSLSSMSLGEALALQRCNVDKPRREFRATSLVERAKEMENLENLLLKGKRRAKSCLLVGPPGSGKTTTCQKILADWASGKAFTQFSKACYVSGREKHTVKAETAPDLLRLERYGASKKDMKDLEENNESLLVILDAADEWGQAWKNYEGIRQLLERERFGNCSLIVTSRPCPAVGDLAECCQVHYYLAGFSERRLEELVKDRLGEEDGDKLLGELKRPETACLGEMMRLTPLLANMICHLFREEQLQNLSTASKTQLYKNMAESFIRRFKKRNEQEPNTQELVLCNSQEAFKELSSLALTAFLEERFMFEKEEVEKHCSHSGRSTARLLQ